MKLHKKFAIILLFFYIFFAIGVGKSSFCAELSHCKCIKRTIQCVCCKHKITINNACVTDCGCCRRNKMPLKHASQLVNVFDYGIIPFTCSQMSPLFSLVVFSNQLYYKDKILGYNKNLEKLRTIILLI